MKLKGIKNSGGVDDTKLDAIIDKALSVLDVTDKINNTPIKPKTDDSEIRKLTKSIDQLWEEARNTKRTNIELWNTKAVQKQVNDAENILNDFVESFDISKISSEQINKDEKQFIKSFATLKRYSEQFGQDINQTYQNIFDSIFNKSDVFKQDDIQMLFQKYFKNADNDLNTRMVDITFQANENYVKQQSILLKEQAKEARKSQEIIEEAERRKRESYRKTRDDLASSLKNIVNDKTNLAKDNQVLKVDEESWGNIQQKIFEIIQELSKMGFEVEDIEDSFAQLQDKIYISPDKLKQARNVTNEIGDEAQGVTDKFKETERAIKSSLDSDNFQPLVKILNQISEHLLNIKNTLGNVDEKSGFSNIISSVDILLGKLDEVKEKIGTGIVNINNNTQGSARDTIISAERDRLMKARDKLVSNFGGETELFSIMGQLLGDSSGKKYEEFSNLFAKNSISSITNPSEQINRLRDFFNWFRAFQKAVSDNVNATENYIETLENEAKKAKNNSQVQVNLNQQQTTDKKLKIKQKESSFNADENSRSIERAKQELEIYKQIEKSSKNSRLPSDYNSNLNKKLNEVNKEEKEELQEEKVTLSQLVQLLTDIRTLTNDISQKDLFGDSLEKFTSQLDNIIDKFDKIVADVKVINDSPIQTSDQGVTSSVDKTRKKIESATKAQKEFNQSIKEGQNTNINQQTIESEIQASKESSKQKEILIGENERVASSGINTASALQQASNGIEAEGNAAINAAKQKDIFTEANKRLADSASATAQAVSAATTAIEAEGKAAKNNSGIISNFNNSDNDNKPIGVRIQKDRYEFGSIRHEGTYEEISQEAYDVLHKLNNNIPVSKAELQTLPEVVEGYKHLDKNIAEFQKRYSYLNKNIKDTNDLDTEERKALRERILQMRKDDKSYSGRDKNGNDVYNGKIKKEKKAVIVTGLPASGKSSSLVNPLSEYYGARVLDSDIIKQLLPEFDNGWGASLVHKESGVLNRRLLDGITGKKDKNGNIIEKNLIDMIGDNVIIPIVGETVGKVTGYVQELKEAGYDIQVMTNELPNNLSSMRNLLRFFSDNRFLEPGFVKDYGDKPSQVYDQLKNNNMISGLYKYNNNVERGHRPILMNSTNTDKSLISFLNNYQAPITDDKDNIGDLQKKIQFIDKLIEKRHELLELAKHYSKESTEYQEVAKNFSDVSTMLNENLGTNFATNIEAESLENLTDAANDAHKAKESVAEANEKVKQSVTPSEDALNSEKSTLDSLSNSAKETAKAKESVAEANEKVKQSQDEIKTDENLSSEKEREENIQKYIKLVNDKNKLEKQKIKYGDNEARDKEINRINTQIEELKKLNFTEEENERIARGVAKTTAELADALSLKELKDDKSLLKYRTDLENAINSLDVLDKKRNYIPSFSSQIDSLKITLNSMYKDSKNLTIVSEDDIQKLNAIILKLKELSKQATLAENKAANEKSIQKNLAKINDILGSNTKSAFKNTDVYQEYIRLQNLFKNFDTSRPQSELNDLITELLKVDAAFNELDNSLKGKGFWGQVGQRLSDMNAKFIAQYFSFQDIIRYARQAATNVIQLNDAFIELSKVSNTSIKSLEGDFQSYADIAKDIGGTITDTINATADWARMGMINAPLYGDI